MKLATLCLIAASMASGQDTVEAHRAAARAAAGKDLMGIFEAACPTDTPGGGRGRGGAAGQRVVPPREEWYAEPVKVFDNLYFVGTKVHGAWAVTTSDGIIVIDALYDYAAEPEIADGLKKLGLDPADQVRHCQPWPRRSSRRCEVPPGHLQSAPDSDRT